MKKLVSALGVASIILAATGVASADVISGVSDGSNASIADKTWFSAKVSNKNSAYIKNNATSVANTGGNKVQSLDDQSGTVVTTGNALSETVVSNSANFSSVSVSASGGCGCDNDLITDVSDDSTSTIYKKDGVKVEVDNDSEVVAENEIAAFSDTGNNEIFSADGLDNTSVTSGLSLSSTGIYNFFNKSVVNITRSFGF
jgi:hypothetical protein